MIDKAELDEAEKVFRSHAQNLEDLRSCLTNQAFKNALELLRGKRRFQESLIEASALAGDALISVRMNSQRIGADGLIDDLWELTTPYRPPQEDIPADYGANLTK